MATHGDRGGIHRTLVSGGLSAMFAILTQLTSVFGVGSLGFRMGEFALSLVSTATANTAILVYTLYLRGSGTSVRAKVNPEFPATPARVRKGGGATMRCYRRVNLDL